MKFIEWLHIQKDERVYFAGSQELDYLIKKQEVKTGLYICGLPIFTNTYQYSNTPDISNVFEKQKRIELT